jgi:hypothetical protein
MDVGVTMKKLEIFLILVFCLSLPGLAQEVTPEALVKGFYQDFQANQDNRKFIPTQKARLSEELYTLLCDIADNQPGIDEAWLDFDPFTNSQMNAATLSVGNPQPKGQLTYLPVAMSLRNPGNEKVRVHVVVGEEKGNLKILNFVYPAESGMPSWDLKKWLKTQLKP